MGNKSWYKEHGGQADDQPQPENPSPDNQAADPAAPAGQAATPAIAKPNPVNAPPHVPLDPAKCPGPVAVKATISFQPAGDDGVLTASPVGAFPNEPLTPDGTSVPEWGSDNPGLVVAMEPGTSLGLKAVVRPGVPPEVIIGAIVSVRYQLAGNVTVEGVSAPIDVVKGGHKGWKVVSRTKQ